MAQTPWNKGLKGFNRPMRQSRYRDLMSLGFLEFEARELSVMPRSIPYLKEMAKERYAEKKRWIRAGKTESEWITHIRRRYPMKDWGRAGDKSAAWAMLRDTEKPWKEKHPDYVRGYPKKSHHRDGGKTANKLQGGLLESYKQELRSYGGVDNERTQALKEIIKRMESKCE